MTSKPETVTIDADVARWASATLFGDPATGQGGVQVQGIPGTAEFDAAVEIFTRAKDQLSRS